jgi:hypothetical protein
MTKKISSIIVFGDSHFAGAESIPGVDKLIDQYYLSQISIEEIDNIYKEYAFSSVLGKLLNIPVYNFAMSGGSNDRSLRLLPNKLLEHPNSLVIFGWTHSDRTEIYYPKDSFVFARDKDLYLQLGMQWYQDSRFKNQLPINNIYVEEFLQIENNNNEKILNQMFYVDSVCKNYASEYIQILGSNNLISSNYKNMLDIVGKKILKIDNDQNQGYGSYYQFCLDRNYKRQPFGHFDKIAQENFAHYVFNNLAL